MKLVGLFWFRIVTIGLLCEHGNEHYASTRGGGGMFLIWEI